MDALAPTPDPDMMQPVLWDAAAGSISSSINWRIAAFRTRWTDRYVDLRLWGEPRIERNYAAGTSGSRPTTWTSTRATSSTAARTTRSAGASGIGPGDTSGGGLDGVQPRADPPGGPESSVSLGTGQPLQPAWRTRLHGALRRRTRWAVQAWIAHSIPPRGRRPTSRFPISARCSACLFGLGGSF